MKLRHYQQKGLDDLKQFFAQGGKRAVFYLPTGGGKTRCAIEITTMAREKNKKVLFLCHRKDLVKQAWERFAAQGIYPGILQGTNTFKPHSEVTVGSIQTFASRKKFGWEFDFDLVIVDECHVCAGSKHYQDLFKSWNNLPIVGLSATPFSKGLGRQGMFEKIIVGASIEQLIEDKFLVDCEIYAPSEPDLKGVKIVAGDYHQKQLGQAVNKSELIGDIVEHWFKLGENRQTIVFATNIEHSRSIVEQFKAKGVDAVHLDCYEKEDERNAILERFKKQEFKILSNVSLLSEGWDCPATSCMILARPTRSIIRYIQMVGRILRPYDDKTICTLLDHSGSVARLGFPTDELPLELDNGTAKKKEKTENTQKPPKICPRCKAVDKKRMATCPKCGFTSKVQLPKEHTNQEGNLQKIIKMPHDAKQQILSALVGYAMRKGYQTGWTQHKYKRITGVWPKGLDYKPGPMLDFVQNIIVSEQIKYAKGRR